MSDKKPSFPRRALWVRTGYANANSYSDAISIVSVEVLSVIGERACIRQREGAAHRVFEVSVSDLASTGEKASEKSKAHFAALLSRPLLTAKAGVKETAAADTSDAKQTTKPEPLATPRAPRAHLPYADN